MSKVSIEKVQLEKAAEKGLIEKTRINKLWDFFNEGQAPVSQKALTPEDELLAASNEVNFATVGVLLGAVIILAPLIWLLFNLRMGRGDYTLLIIFSLIYALAFSAASYFLRGHKSRIYNNVFNYLSVFLFSLAAYAFMKLGFIAVTEVIARMCVEVVAIIVSLLVFNAYKQKSILLLSVLAGFCFFVDGYSHFFAPGSYSGLLSAVWLYGALLLVIGKSVELQINSRDYTFWVMTMGALCFWAGSSMLTLHGHYWEFAWFALNVVLCGVSLYFKRHIFLVLGLIGVAYYLFDVFFNLLTTSLSIVLGISVVGVLMIIGILILQRVYFKNK